VFSGLGLGLGLEGTGPVNITADQISWVIVIAEPSGRWMLSEK